MPEDMRMRNFEPKTQAAYLRAVRKLAAFLKASPDSASANELRRFQLHLVNQGRSPITLNSTISGLKFFFDVTQGRGEQMSRMQPVRVPFTLGWLNLGDLAQARRDPDAALQLLQAYGDRVIEGAALGALSALATLQPGLDHEAADGRRHAGRYRVPTPDRAQLPPGPGPRRRPARGRLAGPRPCRADVPGRRPQPQH